jgi:UDP-N-acetylglucosamine/UDP-N-acetylgalactosamine diphosphorylase
MGWDALTHVEREALEQRVQSIDFDQVSELFEKSRIPHEAPAVNRLSPAPVESPHADAAALGRAALSHGEAAVVLVAGGQGTRFRHDQPKGMFEIGPVSGKTLFQIHAEKVLATSRRYGGRLPLLIMTSPATDAETRTYFAERKYFGLPHEDVIFFCQGVMPVVDAVTGKLLLDGPGKMALSPNGHGGTLAALRDHGLFDELAHRGIRHIFYFQVDNPLVKIADPAFLGQHIAARSEVSSKVVPKTQPSERVGVFVLLDGKCSMIEYSDLPESLANLRDEAGRLLFRAANPAIHIFDVAFLKHLAEHGTALPFHIARKLVPYWDGTQIVKPPTNVLNALKFEKFIFDTLPFAERWLLVHTNAREEFAPLKNTTGSDSPETVQPAMSALACRWLEQAGISVPPNCPQEISPLLALDAEELASRVARGTAVHGPKYWE